LKWPAGSIGALIDEMDLSNAWVQVLSIVSRNEYLLPIRDAANSFCTNLHGRNGSLAFPAICPMNLAPGKIRREMPRGLNDLEQQILSWRGNAG
jgi:hypothetical protein